MLMAIFMLIMNMIMPLIVSLFSPPEIDNSIYTLSLDFWGKPSVRGCGRPMPLLTPQLRLSEAQSISSSTSCIIQYVLPLATSTIYLVGERSGVSQSVHVLQCGCIL
ncbi:hypothetical protein BKA64DRAFT_653725 [Cadophora sp. MPI-SDFR-AT-0126]|nr:hypothetical protein BKA64DRAFT_653725 [Leotiomycetes sp. MPI-SDFR-AT-0126]